MKLVIGNKNYSSWSLRPWLLMRVKNLEFEEQVIPLYEDDSKPRLLAASASGKVPVLIDGEATIWDSLAIVEHLAERFPGLRIWPHTAAARALARSIVAEMHAGFSALRTHMPMNLRAALPGRGHTPEVDADIARILAIWERCRAEAPGDGPFLFGGFSAADAFYAPVVTRFHTYAVDLPPVCAAYAEAVRALPAMQEWTEAARTEPQRIGRAEPYA